LAVSQSIAGQLYEAQEQRTASVQVPPPRFVKFEAQPALLNESGETSVKLTWETQNASKLHIGSKVFEQPSSGSSVVMCSEPRVFLAEAHGIQGYSGPPAYASATVARPVNSGFLPVWNMSQGQHVLWSFGLGSARPLFKINQTRTDRVEEGMGQRTLYVKMRIYMTPADGVTVADLGTARGVVDDDALTKATYSRAFPQPDLWEGNAIYVMPEWGEGSMTHSSGARMQKGTTWGLKSADGSLAVVWFEGAASELPNSEGGWSFAFAWLDFSKLLAKQPQAEDGDERDEEERDEAR
jgi:hypothetical protein